MNLAKPFKPTHVLVLFNDNFISIQVSPIQSKVMLDYSCIVKKVTSIVILIGSGITTHETEIAEKAKKVIKLI